MKIPEIDMEKLEEVKKLIHQATCLMEEEDCDAGGEAGQKLAALQDSLRKVTGRADADIHDFRAYRFRMDLEEAAKAAMLPRPEKTGLTDEDIRKLIQDIAHVKYDEAMTEYYLEVLKKETGIGNVMDYIYNPEEVGMDIDAPVEEIADRVLADRE